MGMSVGYIREFSWVSGIKVRMQGDSEMQSLKGKGILETGYRESEHSEEL